MSTKYYKVAIEGVSDADQERGFSDANELSPPVSPFEFQDWDFEGVYDEQTGMKIEGGFLDRKKHI